MHAGIAWNLIGAVCNQGSTLLVNLLLANLLGGDAFGQYTMVLATVATLSTLGQLSMGYTATKYIAEFRSVDRERTSRILALCALISAVSALVAALALGTGAGWLARTVLNAPSLAPELRLAAVAVFFTVVNGYLMGALAGLESYAALARAGIVSGTAYTLVCAGLASAFGLRGAVGGLALSMFAQCAVLGWLLRLESARHGFPLTRRGAWQERAIVGHFALPASLAGLVSQPALWIGTALLARQAAGFHQLALFGAANTFRTMVLFVPQVINNVGMAVLNNQRRSSPEGYKSVFRLNALMSTLAATTVAGLLLLAGSLPLRIFGPDFVEGRTALTIMLAAAMIETVALTVYQLIVSRGHIWASLAFVSMPRDVTFVLLALLLVPSLGATGLATAHAAGWTLSLVAIVALVSHRRAGDTAEAAVPAR